MIIYHRKSSIHSELHWDKMATGPAHLSRLSTATIAMRPAAPVAIVGLVNFTADLVGTTVKFVNSIIGQSHFEFLDGVVGQ